MINSKKEYENIFIDGEYFWNKHNKMTIWQIKDAIHIMKISGRLPNGIWEDLKDIHATNYATMYNLTKRMIDANYPGVFTKIKPNLNFLIWIYDGINNCNNL